MHTPLSARLFAPLVFLAASSAFAQSGEADFRALMKERKFAEVETLARARLAKNPQDDMALWYLARTIAGDAKKRDEVMAQAEQCVKVMPQSARCHHALGTLYGSAALAGGMSAILKYGGSVKEEFVKAVELDPRFYDARQDLTQFYLQAPGIAGGSVRKAIENADSTGKLSPGMGAILRAQVHIYEKEFDQAETMLASVKPGNDEYVAESLTQIWSQLGFAMINDKQPSKAQKLFEKMIAMDMNNALMYFGLGRAQLEANLVDAAITSLERALKLNEKIGAHYRLGMAYQAKGDKPRAILAFQQFLSYQTAGKAAEDARARLEQLRKS